MTTFRNDAKGSRGILLANGSYVMIDPGQTKSVPGDKVRIVSAGLTQVDPSEASPRAAEGGDEAELPAPPSSLSQIDPSAPLSQLNPPDIDPASTVANPADRTEADEPEVGTIDPEGQALPNPSPPAALAQLDRDNDGNPGGSLPVKPPALSGMRKDELIAQAEKEGLIVEQIKGTGANGNVIADDIKAAIEAKRAAAAKS